MSTQDLEKRLLVLEEAHRIFNGFSIQQLSVNRETNMHLTMLLGMVRGQEGDIRAMQTDVATIKTDLADVRDRLSQVETRLERIDTRLDDTIGRLDTIITLLQQKGE